MILAINTSTLQFGLALLGDDGSILADHLTAGDALHFGGVMPTLDFLFHSMKADAHDLQAIVVAKGPGSYTGLRVGFSIAKGLSFGLNIPMIGISSLEAMARQVPYSTIPIRPILSSRRGEVFVTRFTWEKDRLLRKEEDSSQRFEDLPSLLEGPSLFIGNDLPLQGTRLKSLFGERVLLAPAELWNLRAASVGALGVKRFQQKDFDDPLELVPLYLRAPDIRMKAPSE
jgi:tRNA threonylcarbamoyladenosine biosynthesis protein TsaB